MEEELLKRNTDCVYFLASPLTCKKGVECEYRHSEIARLNPRDCWYWLSGNCLNPTCAFRHPPLDAGSEPPSESASHPQFSEPVNKTNVPCYFFFNGFCNKGDRCSFLHGPDGNNSARESCKTASAVTDAPPLETKTYVASGTATVPIEVPASSSQPASKTLMELQYQHKENLQASAPNNVSGESSSPQRSESQSEEDEEVRPEFLSPAEGFIHNRSLPSTDQSSEDLLDSHSEPDERWESSPGFDVLVDNKSGGLGYEDDSEYRLASDGDHGELKSHLLNHDYDLEYDSAYMNSQIPCKSGMCDFDGHLDNEHVPDYGCVLTGRAREKKFNPIVSRKRKFLPRDVVVNGRNCMDLRDHLGKRRVFDSYPVTHISERCISSRLISRIQERPRCHGPRGLHGRLVSKVERNLIESLGEMEDRPNRGKQRAGFRRLEINRSRQHYKGKRLAKERFLSSEVSKEQVSRKRRSIQDSSSFSGPKTLAQILEEKRKAREDGDCFGKRGHVSRKSSENFQGPKPLNEILKDKKS